MKTNHNFSKLKPRDFEQVMEACEQLHSADTEHSFIRHSHGILSQAFDNISFSAVAYQLRPFRYRERLILTADYDRWFPRFKRYIQNHPSQEHYIVVADADIGMSNLETKSGNFQYTALCREFHDQVVSHHQLWIGVRDGNELLNYIYSCEKELSEKQLAMLCLVQPHLETAWKNWKHTCSLRQELIQYKCILASSEEKSANTLHIRAALESLTDRQLDVVKLVANGCDNQQVANQLNISVLTVKKHLQAIFQTLKVQHRTELAAIWHQAFSSPPYIG